MVADSGTNVGGSAQLLSELAALRQLHRDAVDSSLLAISHDRVDDRLASTFTCPN
jgi:hypothetical protein